MNGPEVTTEPEESPASQDPDAFLEQAAELSRLGDLTAARTLLLGAVARGLDSEKLWLELAALAIESEEQIRYYRRVLGRSPHHREARYRLAQLLVQRGIHLARVDDRAKAFESFAQASRLDGGNEFAWLGLAAMTVRRRDAANYLRQVLEIDPENKQARAWLDNLQQEIEMEEKTAGAAWSCPFCAQSAVTEVERCPRCRARFSLEEIEPFFRGLDVQEQWLLDAARRLERLAPAQISAQTHHELGLAYLNLGRIPEGITRLRVARELQPEDEMLRWQVEILELRYKREMRRSQREKAPEKKISVLVVDRQGGLGKLVMALLPSSREGKIRVTTSWEKAQALAAATPPNLILLDGSKPPEGMPGLLVDQLPRGVPIVFLPTNSELSEKEQRCLQAAIGSLLAIG